MLLVFMLSEPRAMPAMMAPIRFEKGLSVVDHAVGHGHREHGAGAKAAAKRAEPEAAKEDLEPEELGKVHGLPDEEVKP